MADDDVEKKIRHLSDIRTLLLYSIISALALVVGLFWNDAIKSTIDRLVPINDSLYYKYLAAIIVTVAVVIFVMIIIHGQKVAEKRMQQLLEQKRKMQELVKKKKEGGKGFFGLR